MITWQEDITVYLHRDPVDFRKAINGLSLIVSESMALSPFDPALFVFCNKRRTHSSISSIGMPPVLPLAKAFKKATFKWPKRSQTETLSISRTMVLVITWFDFTQIIPHARLEFSRVS